MKRRERNKGQARAEAVQIRESGRHPFGVLDRYVPLGAGELQLYRAIREAVPILDAAIWKLIRLAGGVAVKCGEPAAQAGLERFLRTVPTGRGQRGIQSFLDCYLDSMLTCGRGVGELVLDCQGREIAALLCAGPEQVEIREGDSPLDFQLCARGPGGTCEPLPWQELLLFTPFQPETEHPYGVSLLRSMPFLTDILLKIYQATGMNWERMGNVRFAVICRPGEGEGAYAQVPVRQILEQLVARTGIPPFLLGLSWSSTERMSAQQADLMTSEITALRRTLEPAVERICEMWLRLHGWGGDVTVDWADINLQDFVEEARAKLYLAQAEAIREEERT